MREASFCGRDIAITHTEYLKRKKKTIQHIHPSKPTFLPAGSNFYREHNKNKIKFNTAGDVRLTSSTIERQQKCSK